MAKEHKNKKFSSVIFLLICIIAVLGGKIIYDAVCEFVYPKSYSEYVEKYAEEYDIDEILLYALIRTESGFDPKAESEVGARGLTQITEETFDWLLTKTGEDYTFDDLFEPEVSIKYGAYFLSILQDEYAITKTVVAAYHAGMGSVSSWLENGNYSDDGVNLQQIPIEDTAHYVNKVLTAIENYKKIYPEE